MYKLVLFFCGLAVSVGITFITSNAMYPWSSDAVSVEVGANLFSDKCSSCHAVQQGSASGLGPSLHNFGSVAHLRMENLSGPEYILQSIFYPEVFLAPASEGAMPAGLGDDLSNQQLKNLVAYVASLGSALEYGEIGGLDIIRPISTDSTISKNVSWRMVESGREQFKSLGCSSCHGIFDFPGENFWAPSLAHAGKFSREYLVTSLRNPSEAITPTYNWVEIETISGESYSGRLLSDAAEHLILFTRDSESDQPVHLKLKKDEIVSIVKNNISRMPVFELEQEKEDAIVEFLLFLQAKT